MASIIPSGTSLLTFKELTDLNDYEKVMVNAAYSQHKNLNSKLGCVVVNLSHSFFKDIKSGIEREATFLGNTLENGKIIVVRNLKKPDARLDIFISLRTILNNIPFACIGFNSSGENILNLELASPAKRRF